MEKKIKRISRRDFLRMTTIAASGVLFAACGTGSEQEAVAPAQEPAAPAQEAETTEGPATEKVTIRWQDWPDWEPFMDKVEALVAAQLPDIQVELEPVGDNFEDKTLTQMAAGTAPDIMTGWGAVFRKWAEKGQLLDLQALVDSTYSPEELEDFHPWQWAGMVAQDTGIRFAMPYYVNVIMLFYNTDAFDAAGVPYPTKDMDHISYAEMLQQMTKKEEDRVVQAGGFVQGWEYDRFQFHVQAYGGHVVNPNDWTECMLDKPEAQEALEWIRARMWDDNSIAQPLQVDRRGEAEIWATGLVASMEGGMGNLAYYSEAPFKFDLTHIPKGPARRATLGTNDGWAIYKGTPHLDPTWEFMTFLTGPDFQKLIIENWGGIPARRSVLEDWKILTRQSFPAVEKANLDAVLEALNEGYPLMGEEFKNQAESGTLLNAALEKVYVVGDTPVSYFIDVSQQVTQLNREA